MSQDAQAPTTINTSLFDHDFSSYDSNFPRKVHRTFSRQISFPPQKENSSTVCKNSPKIVETCELEIKDVYFCGKSIDDGSRVNYRNSLPEPKLSKSVVGSPSLIRYRRQPTYLKLSPKMDIKDLVKINLKKGSRSDNRVVNNAKNSKTGTDSAGTGLGTG